MIITSSFQRSSWVDLTDNEVRITEFMIGTRTTDHRMTNKNTIRQFQKETEKRCFFFFRAAEGKRRTVKSFGKEIKEFLKL